MRRLYWRCKDFIIHKFYAMLCSRDLCAHCWTQCNNVFWQEKQPHDDNTVRFPLLEALNRWLFSIICLFLLPSLFRDFSDIYIQTIHTIYIHFWVDGDDRRKLHYLLFSDLNFSNGFLLSFSFVAGKIMSSIHMLHVIIVISYKTCFRSIERTICSLYQTIHDTIK